MSRETSSTELDRAVLLADPTRRQICAILTAPDPPLAARDLAVELAAWSLDTPPHAVSAEQRRRREIELHHHQLPKLADYGLVSYSRPRRTVSITPAGVETVAAVTDSRQESHEWPAAASHTA